MPRIRSHRVAWSLRVRLLKIFDKLSRLNLGLVQRNGPWTDLSQTKVTFEMDNQNTIEIRIWRLIPISIVLFFNRLKWNSATALPDIAPHSYPLGHISCDHNTCDMSLWNEVIVWYPNVDPNLHQITYFWNRCKKTFSKNRRGSRFFELLPSIFGTLEGS